MPKTTYMLIADSGGARLYRTDPRLKSLELIEEKDNPAGRKSESELGTGRPGRRMGTGGGGIHGLNDHDDMEAHESELFARALCEQLHKQHEAGKFDDLKIAAPPKFLGELRQRLSNGCSNALSLTLNKDLLRSNDADILATFRKAVPFSV